MEKTYHYAKYSHGEAVGIGMLALPEQPRLTGPDGPGNGSRLANLLQKYHFTADGGGDTGGVYGSGTDG